MLELQYELESKAAKWYAMIDIANAFFSILLVAECRPQFGWKHSPTICHGLIQTALEQRQAPEHPQYVDDIIVWGDTAEEVLEKGREIIQILLKAGFAIKRSKVKGPAREIQFLGIKWQDGHFGMSPEKEVMRAEEAPPYNKLSESEKQYALFTDGSCCIVGKHRRWKRHAGYAITTSREVIESGPLPTNTSAQKAELVALTRALELAKGKNINIYTDSRYAFGVVHAHGAIWKERGLLNSQGKSIKHAQEIVRLLEAVQLPGKVAVMHVKAHQKVSSMQEEGNELADREAKEAAKRNVDHVI
uniref:ribonuclease H n=1 Tax=Melopsittacus undulatus TaxID=13146 RepID=A0A8V5GQ22_MELUD